MGATREGWLTRVLFGDVPESVGERFDGEVLLVRRHQPVRSLVGRWTSKWFGEPRD